MISSPSSRKRRSSPDCSLMGCDPPRVAPRGCRNPARRGPRACPSPKGRRAAGCSRCSVMGDQLRHRPVHVPACCSRRAGAAAIAFSRSPGSASRTSSSMSKRAFPLVGFVQEIGQRLRIARRPRRLRSAERRQRLGRDHPGRDGGARSSWPGTARAAGTPRPGCRAPTSR